MDYKTFKTKLSGWTRSQKSQRDNLQELIVAGLVHYEAEQDSTYLTLIVRAAQGVRCKQAGIVSEYIKAHSNLAWGKTKDKKPGFKKYEKGPAKVTMPDQTWYDWEGGRDADKPKPDYDFKASVARAINTALQRAKEGKLKEGQEEEVYKVAADLGIEIK